MARTSGSKNHNPPTVPDTVHFTTEERLDFIATLIVERILEDADNGYSLLTKIGASHESNS